jgi:hypothetical protein
MDSGLRRNDDGRALRFNNYFAAGGAGAVFGS